MNDITNAAEKTMEMTAEEVVKHPSIMSKIAKVGGGSAVVAGIAYVIYKFVVKKESDNNVVDFPADETEAEESED